MVVAKLAIFLLIITSSLLGCVENKSLFGIGTRIIGDQLLVKDVLQAPPTGWSYATTIRFNYAIPEPITYIEIISEENVLAEVNFSYKNDLVEGTITAVNSTETTTVAVSAADTVTSSANKLEVLIMIYGFNETVLNLNSAYVLNRDQHFQGVLEPQDSDEDYYNVSDEELETQSSKTRVVTEEFEDGDENDDDDDDDDDADDNVHNAENVENNDDDLDFRNTDKIIELGQRQAGDYKIYETFQTSLTITEVPTEHSIVFYYIDSTFITFVQFTIYDHSAEKNSPVQNTPVAEYSHYSPNTLKAIITDHNTTSLFVQMSLYGYKPEDRPVDYLPFLPRTIRGGVGSTAPPMSALQRLKQLMNAQQRAGTEATPTTIKDDDADDDDDNDNDNNDDNDGEAADNDINNGDNDDDDDDDDNNDGEMTPSMMLGNNKNNNGNLPPCGSASISMSLNLLIMASLAGFIGSNSLWCTLLPSTFSSFL